MPIDPANVTPGVWEAQSPHGEKWIVEVVDYGGGPVLVANFCGKPFTSQRTVSTMRLDGWQFTARYIRCDGEPAECPCPLCGGESATCPTCDGRGVGVFIPQPKETDHA